MKRHGLQCKKSFIHEAQLLMNAMFKNITLTSVPIAFLSALGLILMFSLTRNQYAWMSEVLENSANLPIDPNSTLKLTLISITGLLICFSNIWVLRNSTSVFQKSIAVIMILGALLAFCSFF